MKKLFLSVTFVLLTVSCAFVSPKPTPTPPPTQTKIPTDDRALFKDGLVASAQTILDDLKDASVYQIEFNVDKDMANVNGKETVQYTNTETVPLEDVRFRLFPNVLGGEMTIDNIAVNGEAVAPTYELNDSLLILPFKTPLQVGESATISMDFAVKVSDTVEQNYGVQAYYNNVLALAHAYPMIAVYDDEGWNAEIPPQMGDVTYADMSYFIVKVTAPKNVILVASGREVENTGNDKSQTVMYANGPARDFYLAASPDYEVFTKESNGITIRFYTRKDLKDGAEYALDVAARALEDFSKRYAPYPYSELDFVSTPTYALGIEYPGMIAINEEYVQPENNILEAVVAHEVGHQWFYNLIGNDQLDDPWLDESLTQFITLQYFADEYGEAGARGYRESMEGRWSIIQNADIPIGLPVRDYSEAEYSGIVYGRGGLFFEALRDQIGADTFDAFLKDYAATNSWKIATPEILKSIAEKHCRCDLTPIFEDWVD